LEIKYFKHGSPLTLHFNDIQNITIMKLTPDMFNLGLPSDEKCIEKLASQILFEDDNVSRSNTTIRTSRIFKTTSVVKPTVVVNSNLTECICIHDNITEECEYIVLET